jgi:hypothetical protein
LKSQLKQIKKPLRVPFDKDGNFVSYPLFDGEEYNYKDNCVFNDTLQFESFYRGRSSAGATFISTITKKVYTMFLIDLSNLLLNKTIVNGKVEGSWCFVRRGVNYGVRLSE